MGTFKAFYESHREKLFAYLMRMTGDYYLASDITQESFTRILSQYGKDSQNGTLLFTIARNAVLDDSRKKNRIMPLGDEKMDNNHNQEQLLLIQESYRLVLAAMQRLNKNERDILALVVSSSMSYRAIAEMTGSSETYVKVTVHRARIKLKKYLQGETTDE
jgi:RNA polymerase sigma-70 factor (ECF subfamily)